MRGLQEIYDVCGLFSLLNRLLSSIWKNMKNHSKKCLQNENERVIMIDGLFSKGVKRRES
jgi:hypothetical protein